MELKSEYKLTEIGVIPEDWSIRDLQGVCAETITYGIVQCGPHVQNGVPYIRVSDMNSERLDVTEMLRTAPAIAAQFSRSRVSEGDIVYALRGKIGEVRRVNPDVAGANLTQGTAKLSPSSRMDSIYLLWSLRSQRALRQGDLAAKGSTFREITLAALRQIQLPVPPISEQRAIANALSDMDALLAKIDQLIAKKRDLKQAAMQQLLTGQTRLPGFSGEWEVTQLGDLLSYEQPTQYLVRYAEYDAGNSVPVLTAGKTFILGYTNETEGVYSSPPVIIFDDFTTASKFVDFPFKAKSSAMKILKAREGRAHIRFVFERMQIIDFQLGDHKRYWISEYSKLQIQTPCLLEQTAIATVLSDMEAELASLEARRDKTRALKQGMMQALLTGRIRLI